ncbi:hypothetical protein Dip510_001966 [Elusimicrobium posterum]
MSGVFSAQGCRYLPSEFMYDAGSEGSTFAGSLSSVFAGPLGSVKEGEKENCLGSSFLFQP